jgi:hypothetical protein
VVAGYFPGLKQPWALWLNRFAVKIGIGIGIGIGIANRKS